MKSFIKTFLQVVLSIIIIKISFYCWCVYIQTEATLEYYKSTLDTTDTAGYKLSPDAQKRLDAFEKVMDGYIKQVDSVSFDIKK